MKEKQELPTPDGPAPICDWCCEPDKTDRYFMSMTQTAVICWECLSQLHHVMMQVAAQEGDHRKVH